MTMKQTKEAARKAFQLMHDIHKEIYSRNSTSRTIKNLAMIACDAAFALVDYIRTFYTED